eukprot:m.90592 g.90592  ORF g.90592 m.90592 type:complete len:157 (+) comp26412_c0_seq1:1275-1745(+)
MKHETKIKQTSQKNTAVLPEHVHRLAGQLGGSWLQFSSHHSSVAPAPGTAWHVLVGPGGGPGGGGPGGPGGFGDGPGAGHGPEGGGGGGCGNGSGIEPLQREAPDITALHTACATSAGEALHDEFAGLNISQKNPDFPAARLSLTICCRSAFVNGS